MVHVIMFIVRGVAHIIESTGNYNMPLQFPFGIVWFSCTTLINLVSSNSRQLQKAVAGNTGNKFNFQQMIKRPATITRNSRTLVDRVFTNKSLDNKNKLPTKRSL